MITWNKKLQYSLTWNIVYRIRTLKKIIGIDEKICIFSKNILNLFFDQLKFNSIDKIKSNYGTKNTKFDQCYFWNWIYYLNIFNKILIAIVITYLGLEWVICEDLEDL